MIKSKSDEKITLVAKILDSYRLEQPNMSDLALCKKFDELYDMETEALRYLASLRKIKNIPEFIEM